MYLHLHRRCIPEQGLSRCHQRYRPTRYINNESGRASSSKLAFLVIDEAQHSRRVFRLSCAYDCRWRGGGFCYDSPDAGVEEVGGLVRFMTYDFPEGQQIWFSFFFGCSPLDLSDCIRMFILFNYSFGTIVTFSGCYPGP